MSIKYALKLNETEKNPNFGIVHLLVPFQLSLSLKPS